MTNLGKEVRRERGKLKRKKETERFYLNNFERFYLNNFIIRIAGDRWSGPNKFNFSGVEAEAQNLEVACHFPYVSVCLLEHHLP